MFVVIVDGDWSAWSVSKLCSQSCGRGSQLQFRKCDKPSPSDGGADCPGFEVQTVPCNEQLCPGIDANSKRNKYPT